jgi:subtilisin-like proprotein convertase family protein
MFLLGSLLCGYVSNVSLGQDSETQPRKFGAADGKLVLPGFGKDKLVVPYGAEDMKRAESLVSRYDRNKDGVLDTLELKEGVWRYGNPLDFDFNGDGKLNKIEMAQRLSARSNKDEGYTPPPPRFSVLEQIRNKSQALPEPQSRRGYYRGEGGNRRSQELAYDIMSRYDRDQNRKLDPFERKELGIDVAKFDINGDSSIDNTELYQWIDSQISERVGDLTDVLPDWFFERDTNEDQQIDMSEFSEEWTDELLAQFKSFDANQDGVITALELTDSRSVVGGVYTTTNAVLISPRSSASSSIVIEDDLQIEKIRVQLTITHDYTEQLSAYLKSPTGTKIDLFRGPGGSGDHFENTIFDDEAGDRIQRASAPFRGSYQPVAIERNLPSLRSLRDTSLKGEWQLVIEADRNQRFGILHSWSLLVVPRKQQSVVGSSEATE